jgi:hypothetical protein
MDLGLQMRDNEMSSKDVSKKETPQNLMCKSIKELAKEVLAWEITKLHKCFKQMAIAS